MKRTALTILVLLVLTGCSAPIGAPEEVPSPSPTIDIGPVSLSEDAAAQRYLQLVCQTNASFDSIDDAVIAGEPEWLNGGNPDPAAVKAAASEALRVVRLAVEVIDDDYFAWPDEVATQLGFIRESFIQELAVLSGMANASRFEDAYYVQWPERTPEQAGAGQEIRYQLGIEADTTVSCAGYEDALDTIHAEMLERQEYLSSFETTSG